MRTSKLLLAALLLLSVSIPAFGQLTDTYVIPAAANAPGGNGTRWLTQLSIFNPHFDYSLKVSVVLLPTGGTEGPERLITIPPNSTFITDNAMLDIFNRSGSGALLLATFPEDNQGVEDSVVARAFLVTSNTYNNSSSGTFGQTIPGVWAGLLDVDTDGITAIAHGIDNSSRLRFRTNVGAVNLGPGTVTVYVSVYDADGRKVLDEAPLFVPPYAHLQDRLPVNVEGGSVEFFIQDPWADTNDYAVVFPYTSTIDDISGDPRYQTPVLLATPNVIYGKKGGAAAAAALADPTKVGKKIDVALARKARANAERLEPLTLERSERGWVVAK